MDKDRILIALKDEGDVKVFKKHMSDFGLEVNVAKDGAMALELAIETVPALVVAEPELPVIGGEKVFQILRNNPHTSKIPFLFISDNVTDIKNFRTGLDVFLLKPFNMDEVKGRIAQTLSRKEGLSPDSRDIEGKLSHMSVADILQFLQLNNKEGELRVVSGTNVGTVYVKEGQIFNSIVDGVEKEKALFRLLGWTDGTFEFIPRQISITKKISASTGNLLMEGMRQIDEFRKHAEKFPDPDNLVTPKLTADKLPAKTPQLVREIFDMVDSCPKIGEIVERCSHTDYEVYKAISSMISHGILNEEKPEGSAGGASEDFLTNDQAISIREKIISRFTNMVDVSFARILLLATSGSVINSFIDDCRRIKGFKINQRTTGGEAVDSNPVGEVATFKLYGGMDLVLFSVPNIKDMGPVWKSFSTNLIGVVLLWDKEGMQEMKDLAEAKKELVIKHKVPVVHIFTGDKGNEDDSTFIRKTFELKSDEPVFYLDSADSSTVTEALYSLFTRLLKEEELATA